MSKYYVTMTDKFMSGWGMAKGRTNKYVVECDNYEQAKIIERNARKRSEMKYVNIRASKPSYGGLVLTTWKHFNDLSGPWKA